jgi:predicted secreted protein with PEFG-CTERM motif
MGLLHIDGYLHIDEDSTFYNIGNAQTISFNGERFEMTGAGELIIDPNASVLLEGELKNSGLIDNAGAFDINMCSGSVDNIGAATITNVENGVVNEIACNNQPVNPPANPGADTTAPVISIPENITVEVATESSSTRPSFSVTAFDNADGNIGVACNPSTDSLLRVGITTIRCTATDNAGNVSEESFLINVVVRDNAVTCGTGTELFAGECRAIPVRDAPVVQPPVVQQPVAPQVQETVAPIGLIATVTDNYENGVTTLDIKFNKNFVNYEIEVTQNGDTLLRETDHALGTSVTYKVTAQGSVENPIDVKLTSLGIGLPGQESRWTGPTGLITNVQVVPEFGTIAMMILVVAIVSIVAVTSKSRLIAKF